MDRREFLTTAGTLIAGASLQASALVNATSSTHLTPIGGRLLLPINQEWTFSKHLPDGFERADFDDSGFESICLPHTNLKLPWHSFDEKSYQFVSAYRRRFRLPPDAKGKHVFVDFEGVMTAATVWINDQKLGEYRGGYTPFSFDLTPYVDWNGENVLAVAVDSSERPDIPPFGGKIDYLTFGGIYREVSLRVVPKDYIENVFAQPLDVLTNDRKLLVRCHLAGEAPTGSAIVELRDGERVVAS